MKRIPQSMFLGPNRIFNLYLSLKGKNWVEQSMKGSHKCSRFLARIGKNPGISQTVGKINFIRR